MGFLREMKKTGHNKCPARCVRSKACKQRLNIKNAAHGN